MNTPAHALVNMLLLGREGRPETALPLALGGLLPDVPMFVFYTIQRLQGAADAAIWTDSYWRPGWQALFDAFHSLPLIALAGFGARLAGWRWLVWLAAGMALHSLIDLGVHHADAHRHFWPLLDWRFHSPVSYWNPAHFGRPMALLEVAICGFATAWLWRRYTQPGLRALVASLAGAYAAHWLMVFTLWV